jgi:hypothetical protein
METDKKEKVDSLDETIEFVLTKKKHYGSKGEDKNGDRYFVTALREMLGLQPLHGDGD